MRQAGFTLLELIVSVVIAGIVLVMAVPNIRSFQETQRLSRGTDIVAAACIEARAKARAKNHNVIVDYRRDVGQVAVIEDVDNDGVVDAGETEVVRSLEAGVTLDNTTFADDKLIFDSRGSAVAGGSVILTGAASTAIKRIRISAGTGHVAVRSVESTDDV